MIYIVTYNDQISGIFEDKKMADENWKDLRQMKFKETSIIFVEDEKNFLYNGIENNELMDIDMVYSVYKIEEDEEILVGVYSLYRDIERYINNDFYIVEDFIYNH